MEKVMVEEDHSLAWKSLPQERISCFADDLDSLVQTCHEILGVVCILVNKEPLKPWQTLAIIDVLPKERSYLLVVQGILARRLG